MLDADVFAPEDPAFVADPYPAYRVLREGPRVAYHTRTDRWLVARHADVDALLRDRRLGRTYLQVASHAEMGRPDDPPELTPFWRASHPHVSFGDGVHFCLGAALARLELQTSFGTVLRRLPHLELVEQPRWRPGDVLRGLQELRVSL